MKKGNSFLQFSKQKKIEKNRKNKSDIKKGIDKEKLVSYNKKAL